MTKDESSSDETTGRLPSVPARPRMLLIGISALAALTAGFLPRHDEGSWSPLLDPVARAEGPARRSSFRWVRDQVERGDSFGSLVSRWIDPSATARAVEAVEPVFDLARLRAGHEWSAAVAPDGQLAEWHYEIDPEETLVVRFGDNGDILPVLDRHPFELVPAAIEADVTGSLFGAVSPEGNRDAIAAQLAEIFGWQVDFHHDLRRGDRIEVLFEERVRDDETWGTGKVLFAALTVSGHRYEAWAHESDGRFGYYDRDGRSLKKQFLRSPLEYGRVTSGFSHRRLHPVTKRYRPHYGVDYAAPTGTPIRATGDGVVTRVERGRAEGLHIAIRHANGWETWYLHMSRTARGVARGRRVTQGETIGFVGSSGYATGPHVDYRMKHHGSWVNPRQATPPPAPPLAESEMASFRQRRSTLEQAYSTLLGAEPLAPAG